MMKIKYSILRKKSSRYEIYKRLFLIGAVITFQAVHHGVAMILLIAVGGRGDRQAQGSGNFVRIFPLKLGRSSHGPTGPGEVRLAAYAKAEYGVA